VARGEISNRYPPIVVEATQRVVIPKGTRRSGCLSPPSRSSTRKVSESRAQRISRLRFTGSALFVESCMLKQRVRRAIASSMRSRLKVTHGGQRSRVCWHECAPVEGSRFFVEEARNLEHSIIEQALRPSSFRAWHIPGHRSGSSSTSVDAQRHGDHARQLSKLSRQAVWSCQRTRPSPTSERFRCPASTLGRIVRRRRICRSLSI